MREAAVVEEPFAKAADKTVNTSTVYISKPLYERILHMARRVGQSPDRLIEAILWEHFPAYPHIEIKHDRWGEYAVITGTRTSVATVVRYMKMGYDANTIATEILPHLTLAQVHSALAYYFEHQEEIDAEMATDTNEVWQARLKELVGEKAYRALASTVNH